MIRVAPTLMVYYTLPYNIKLYIFPQQQNFAMGSLAQISSGAIRCSFNTRFRTRFRHALVQIPREVPEGSGEDTCWGSGGFCAVPEGSGALVSFWKFPVQVLGEVPEGLGADTWLGSTGFWCRYLVRFRKFPVQLPDEVPEGLGEDAWWGSGGLPCEVPEGFGGEDAWWGSGGFRCRYLVRFRSVLVQMLCKIAKGSDAFYGIST